jgi:predicted nucleotidyltransferase
MNARRYGKIVTVAFGHKSTTPAAIAPAPRLVLPRVALEYARRLRERFGGRVVDVRLFGSFARGEPHDESDIDVLVLIRDLTRAEKIESIEIGAMTALGSGRAISPLPMEVAEFDRLRSLEARLALDIDREGVAL